MPRQKPPAEMDLPRVVAANRAAIRMRPGVSEPALRIVRVARRAILHLLDRGLELCELCRILGEAGDVLPHWNPSRLRRAFPRVGDGDDCRRASGHAETGDDCAPRWARPSFAGDHHFSSSLPFDDTIGSPKKGLVDSVI